MSSVFGEVKYNDDPKETDETYSWTQNNVYTRSLRDTKTNERLVTIVMMATGSKKCTVMLTDVSPKLFEKKCFWDIIGASIERTLGRFGGEW